MAERSSWLFKVFPTHVGVFLSDFQYQPPTGRLPHARGGVSPTTSSSLLFIMSSPRTWGCFLSWLPVRCVGKVFPTHVGVFLRVTSGSEPESCLPHARGGVSMVGIDPFRVFRSSPRTWGCFYAGVHSASSSQVFPTHVGVFL